jgi:hypothetical protein
MERVAACLLDRSLGGVGALGEGPDDQVPVGDDSAQPALGFGDDEAADVAVAHHSGCLGNRAVGLDHLGVTGHDLAHLGGHGVPPKVGFDPAVPRDVDT